MKRLLLGISSAVLLFAGGSAAQAHGIHYQTANMHTFPGGVDIAGGGTLTRTRNAVTASLATTGLDSKAAYTVWWVVFNNPDRCSEPCGLDDLGNAAVAPGVFYAAGFIAGMDGTANVVAHLESGALPEGADELLGTGQGLRKGNGFDAEIHMIVRSHGNPVPGAVDVQIGTFAGACGPAPAFPNCADQQAIAFLPAP